MIFNAVLRFTCYPFGWKSTRIISVPKPRKDHHSPEGYRPMSLLCTISKVFETLPLARNNDHLDEHRPVRIQIKPLDYFTALPNYESRRYCLQQKTNHRPGVSVSRESLR
ncbi:hypothetical protein Trydic_g16282 [Trypoxylus dichotomus]